MGADDRLVQEERRRVSSWSSRYRRAQQVVVFQHRRRSAAGPHRESACDACRFAASPSLRLRKLSRGRGEISRTFL